MNFRILSCFIPVFLFFAGLPAYAQKTTKELRTQRMDSLRAVLAKSKEDTLKVNTLNELAVEFFAISEFDSVLKLNRQSLALAEKLNFKRGQSASYMGMGSAYILKGNYSQSLISYFAAMEIQKEIGGRKSLGICYNNTGVNYKNLGNYPEALKYYFLALNIREDIHDERGIASTYNNIGVVYENEFNTEEAFKYYTLSLNIKIRLKDKKGIASSYNNLGSLLFTERRYDDALKNFNQALAMDKERGSKFDMATDYNNIGAVYYEMGDHEKAFEFTAAAMKLRKEIKDLTGISHSYVNLANISLQKKKYADAQKYAGEALRISLLTGNKKGIEDAWIAKTKLDSIRGNFAGAFAGYKMMLLYRDSLFGEETQEKTVQAQMTYEFERKFTADSVRNMKDLEIKNEQIAAKNAQITEEETRKYTLIGWLSLFLLLSVFLVSRFMVTRRQKKIIEVQKNIVEEKQREVLDSIHYAKRIQQALLPSEKYIERNLNRMMGGRKK